MSVELQCGLSNDCGYNTQRGDDVKITLLDNQIDYVKTSFEKVLLSGETTVEVKMEDVADPVPEGFKTLNPSKIFDIKTSALFEGEMWVDISYEGLTFEREEALSMLHYDTEARIWQNISQVLKMQDDIATGVIKNLRLSPFVIVEDIQPPEIECTDDISVHNDPGILSAIVSYDPPSASDNSGSVIVEQIDDTGLSSGSQFAIGVTTLIYQATDGAGLKSTCSFNITVQNPAPVIEKIIAPVDPVAIGNPVAVGVIFSDNNFTTAELDWGESESNWIDGIITDNTITWNNKLYETTGVYPITIRLTDLGGEVTEEVYRYIVVYDPTEGFVTGGGWIYSPREAYSPDPLLEGKANFGFVSKYKKGSNVPDGNTEFQFKAGNLNFKSTVYEWLVIAGSKAMFKGSGTINGIGNYGFMLSAIDGEIKGDGIDKFRIKIWDKDNDVVVYDNNLEVDDIADPTTEIGGGSIIIHTGKTKSAEIESGLISKAENSNISVYPNPFNDRLHFEFMCPKDVSALIEIYDLTGRKIETVFDGKIKGGVKNNVDFVSESDVTGIYFYRIKLGEEVYYNKVICVKR